jgi:hypothetical protein
MKAILSERSLVVVLFVMVLITFSLAQEDSKKVEKMFTGIQSAGASHVAELRLEKQTSNQGTSAGSQTADKN